MDNAFIFLKMERFNKWENLKMGMELFTFMILMEIK